MNEKVEAWADKCYRYKARWIGYLTKLYGAKFIREFGAPWRILVETPEDVYRYIGYYNRNRIQHAFISVNGYLGKIPAPNRKPIPEAPAYESVVDLHHFSDFDGDPDKGLGIERAHQDALTWFDKFTDPGREIRFSGSKGFAVEIKHAMLLDIKAFNERVKSLNFPTLDRTTNNTQIYRIPYTLHPKSLRQCIPIRPDWDLARILDESEMYRPPPVVIP